MDPEVIGAKKEGGATGSGPGGATAAPSGKEVFSSAGCGGCHTLAAAGSSGTTGPNLDDAKPSADTVEAIVTTGAGIMPSFKGRLSAAEIEAVAQFVAGSEQTAKSTASPAATPGRRPSVAAQIRVGRGPDGITVAGSERPSPSPTVGDSCGSRMPGTALSCASTRALPV